MMCTTPNKGLSESVPITRRDKHVTMTLSLPRDAETLSKRQCKEMANELHPCRNACSMTVQKEKDPRKASHAIEYICNALALENSYNGNWMAT